MICDLKRTGIGYFPPRRKGAKVMGKSEKRLQIIFTRISELCGLCAFAGDIPRFGCGCVALGPS
jgi:hypothetical protein